MKTCPKCKHENPSAARHCMYCGELLDDEENLTENDSLKKELEETNRSIASLKQSFLALQSQMNNSNNSVEINRLVKQIEDNNKAVLSLQKEIETKGDEIAGINAQLITEKNRNKRNKQCCFLLLALLAIVGVFFIIQSDKLKHKNLSIDNLREKNVVLKHLGDSLLCEIRRMHNSYDSLLLKCDSLSKINKQLMTKNQQKNWERVTRPQPNLKKIVVQPEPIIERNSPTKQTW